MHIMYFHTENIRNSDVETCVVQRSEEASRQDKEVDSIDMARDDEDRQQMQVLAHHEFKRMHVDGVQVASGGSFLLVVMLVDVAIK